MGGDKEFDSRLIWRVFPASRPTKDSFTLYDGTQVTAETSSRMIQVRCVNARKLRDYEIIVPASQEPRLIELSGQTLAILDGGGHRGRKKGWWLNSDGRTLHVVFTSDDFVLKISE